MSLIFICHQYSFALAPNFHEPWPIPEVTGQYAVGGKHERSCLWKYEEQIVIEWLTTEAVFGR